jgi:hypothetical protein
VTLSPKQLQALSLLGRGDAPKSIAATLDISTRTLQRWQLLPEFRDLIEKISNQTKSLTVESTTESFQKEQQIWQTRRDELRNLEWELSQLLLKKARQALEDLEISGRIQNIANALKIGSELGRVSSELWSSDLNAAISLVRQYGFDIVDVNTKENEFEEFEKEDD